MSRVSILNLLLEKSSGKKYLEIGVNTPAQPGYSRDKIDAEVVHGVDPNPATKAEYIMTSDVFFADHCEESYDVIFVDGLHRFENAYRDILNSLEALNEDGIVVVHDTRPVSFSTQTRQQGRTLKWHGDVWRAIVFLRLTHPWLAITTVDTDEGLTLISKEGGKPYDLPLDDDLFNWAYFARNYDRILNLMSVEEFLSKLGR